MLSFFLFWGTLLFHIWPPSLYMTEVRKIGSQDCTVNDDNHSSLLPGHDVLEELCPLAPALAPDTISNG